MFKQAIIPFSWNAFEYNLVPQDLSISFITDVFDHFAKLHFLDSSHSFNIASIF